MELPVVYTAIFGKFDTLLPPLHPDGARWVCFADAISPPSPWEVMPHESRLDPRRHSRWCKLHPHILFPDAEVTIWHGGNVRLTHPVQDYVNLLGDGEIAALPHPLRNSAYDEAAVCRRDGKAPPIAIQKQMNFYKGEGFDGKRLHAAFLLVRRNTPLITELNELWWSQLEKYTIRDQLSFDYCLWKLGITPVNIPFVNGSHDSGPYHRRHRHRVVKLPTPRTSPKKKVVKRVRKRPKKRAPQPSRKQVPVKKNRKTVRYR